MNKILHVILILFLINGFFVASLGYASALDLSEDSWNTKTPMSQARAGLGVVAVDGKIYAIGGSTANGFHLALSSSGGYVGTNEQYDPKTDTWTILEPMPTPRAGFAIAAYDGKIYCIGGFVCDKHDQLVNLNVVEVYDIGTNSWSTKNPIPINELVVSSVSGPKTAGIINGNIFIIANQWNLFMYNPVDDVWVEKNHVPLYLHAVSTVADGKVIVTGNFLHMHFEPKVMIYDPETDMWRYGKSGPLLEGSSVAVGVTTGLYAPQNIYVFSDAKDTVAYDPLNDDWMTAQNMPTDRIAFGVAVVDDVVYVIGGFSTNSPLTPYALNEQYVPIGYSASHGALWVSLTVIVSVVILIFVAIAFCLLKFNFFRTRRIQQKVFS